MPPYRAKEDTMSSIKSESDLGGLKQIYRAPTEAAAQLELERFSEKWD